MACWVGRGDKKRRRGRKGRSRIQGEERRHRTEGGDGGEGGQRMREAAGEARRRGRERGLEGLGPVRFRAEHLTRWRAGRVGSAFHCRFIPLITPPLTVFIYLTLTPTYSHFYYSYYHGYPLRIPICLCRHYISLLLRTMQSCAFLIST